MSKTHARADTIKRRTEGGNTYQTAGQSPACSLSKLTDKNKAALL
ncbi:hypothetical protein [Solimicrobium silvestre]|nr:hypothetical protein [Solimicrobium silvestre]